MIMKSTVVNQERKKLDSLMKEFCEGGGVVTRYAGGASNPKINDAETVKKQWANGAFATEYTVEEWQPTWKINR